MFYFILFIIIIVVIIYIAVSYNFSQTVKRKICNPEELFKQGRERNFFDEKEYNSYKKEKVEVKTKDGLTLKGIYIEGDKTENNTIIFVHGITVGIPWSIKYIKMFIVRGWNVLMYDQRRHGYSEGEYSTFGYYEKEDLDIWVNWVKNRNGEKGIIGLHGESMGAATVLQYAPLNKYAKFLIADCPYSDLEELLRYEIKNAHFPTFPVLQLTSAKVMRKAKFKFSEVKPIQDIKKSDIPILFIHGKEDKFVPCNMSEKMFEIKKGMKKIYIAEGAAHARSFETNRERYEKEVFDFITEVIKGDKNET